MPTLALLMPCNRIVWFKGSPTLIVTSVSAPSVAIVTSVANDKHGDPEGADVEHDRGSRHSHVLVRAEVSNDVVAEPGRKGKRVVASEPPQLIGAAPAGNRVVPKISGDVIARVRSEDIKAGASLQRGNFDVGVVLQVEVESA